MCTNVAVATPALSFADEGQGYRFLTEGQYRKALTPFQRFVSSYRAMRDEGSAWRPMWGSVYDGLVGLGAAYARLGDAKRADAAWREALGVWPLGQPPGAQTADAFGTGKINEGFADYEGLLFSQGGGIGFDTVDVPSSAIDRLRAGLHAGANGKYRQALEELNDSLKLAPLREPRYARGEILWHLGRVHDARNDWLTVLESPPQVSSPPSQNGPAYLAVRALLRTSR